MTLNGKRIVITRAAHQYAEFAALLIAEGAQPLAYPAIEIVPIKNIDWQGDSEFDWIILTSANAAQAVSGRHTLTSRTRIAAVGPATADAVRRFLGVNADVAPTDANTAHLLQALPVRDGERALLPQSEFASPELARGLRARGVDVTVIPAYTVITASGGVDLPTLIALRGVDAITFTSGSTVEHFLIRYLKEGGALADLRAVPLAYFGESAGVVFRNAGLQAAFSAAVPSLKALISAMKEAFHGE